MMRDGQYGRISLGKHNSIFIGGIAHELGHGLSLPHNMARPDEAAASGTATAVPDQNGHFTLHCRGLAPGKSAELRIVSCHVNGRSPTSHVARHPT